MNAKPKDAIAALRHYMADRVWPDMPQASLERVLAWADSIPEGAVPVVWPAELTRERLEKLANDRYLCQPNQVSSIFKCTDALRALAAIAPVRKKRVVNLWRDVHGFLHEREVEREPERQWRCVARNVELED